MTANLGNPLLETLVIAASALKSTGVPFALAGSFAAYAHGGASSDHDVDFLVRHQDLEKIQEALESEGFRIEQPPGNWLVKAYHGEHLVDLIYRPIDIPVTDKTFLDASSMKVGSITAPVLSATQLMVHKLLSLDEHYLDFGPALQLARSLREKIGWEEVRKETAASPYSMAFLFLVEKLGIALTNG